MTWYSTPLQPLDPVVQSQTPKPPIRYMRDSFAATGQNSYVLPPSQDQSMWQSLLNVMPITQGQISQRWGYDAFATIINSANRLYNYQSDALGTRAILACSLKGITAFNENGTVQNPNVFTPVASSEVVRSITSRNYQYFCDGDNGLDPTTHRTGDSLKWDGVTSATVLGYWQAGVTYSVGQIIYDSNDNPEQVSSVQQYHISVVKVRSNVVTLTFTSVDIVHFPMVGTIWTLENFVNAAFLNGTSVTITSVFRGINEPSYVTAAFTHADYGPITESSIPAGNWVTTGSNRSGATVPVWPGSPSGTVYDNQIQWTRLASVPVSISGVSNIGIIPTDVTTNTITGAGGTGVIEGPITGTAAVDIPTAANNPWTNPAGILTNNPGTPAYVSIYQTWDYDDAGNGTLITDAPTSDTINTTGFTFASFPSPQVVGIQLAFTYQSSILPYTYYPSGSMQVQLLKNGSPVGQTRSGSLTIDGTSYTLTVGGSNDLWGTSFVPSDLTNGSLGVAVYMSGSFQIFAQESLNTYGFQFSDSYITMTTFGASSPGTIVSSGAGVGIAGTVGNGDITLVLGRTYYLIPNNSSTGHFGDLSAPSANTGAVASSEFSLALASYNDPQVDFKYVLATADGGDPSILYQVSVLVPGLVVTSWAIDGSDNVTFTGTWNGTPFPDGSNFTVGGLNHGAYMNNYLFTVTGSSPTTVVGTFTHGADSATEFGIVAPASAGTSGATVAGQFAIPNNVFAVVDNDPDPNLVLNQPMLFTDTFGTEYGVTLNDPPPAGTLLIKHQGRLWMAGVPGATHSVFFSKSVSELTLPNGFIAGKYEESWPGFNYFDVSDGAESVLALQSDGTTLYIGTQNHVRRLFGNDPTNFQEPQIVHPEVGVINQEVWQIVFMQGAPSGCCWMTPDFRVIQSDFNTYVDIGTPVQNILNALQPTAQSLAHAAFVADGEYDLYILAVPYLQSSYCDTMLVFDLRARQWFVWQPAGGSISLLYNVTQAAVPQWLFLSGLGNVLNIFAQSATTDNGAIIPVTAQTTWMNLGEPTRRKVLNEIQIYGNPAMKMNVYGANNLADFSAPRPVVYNHALRQSPFGVWTLYLTGAKSRHRYYQFTFSSNDGIVPLLGSYSISVMPLDDI